MKKVFFLIVLCAAVFTGFSWHTNRRTEAFVDKMRKEYQGYRLEYFQDEKLLFLHAPDGSKEGMPLDRKCIEQIFLTKIPASENAFNKDIYRWQIQYVMSLSKKYPLSSWIRRRFPVPYFSLEPIEFLGAVKKEVPEIDIDQSLRYTKQFERNERGFYSIWVHPEHKINATPQKDAICTQ
jgi:hypothetical protein